METREEEKRGEEGRGEEEMEFFFIKFIFLVSFLLTIYTVHCTYRRKLNNPTASKSIKFKYTASGWK